MGRGNISDYQKFYLTPTPNQHYKSPVPFHSEGVSRSSQARDGIAMDARAAKTSAAFAYGEIVWVRRPGAGVKSADAKAKADDGGKKAGHQDDLV